MNQEKFAEAIENAGGELAKATDLLREKAEFLCQKEIESMKERGQAVELGDDELRLLKAYQAFKNRSPAGSVFSWETPVQQGIVVPTEPCLITDPRELSAPRLP